jgi:hypothetical protein
MYWIILVPTVLGFAYWTMLEVDEWQNENLTHAILVKRHTGRWGWDIQIFFLGLRMNNLEIRLLFFLFSSALLRSLIAVEKENVSVLSRFFLVINVVVFILAIANCIRGVVKGMKEDAEA